MSFDPSNNIKNSLYPKQHFEDEDEDSWQISYLDIITVILGFLIILLSVSRITEREDSSVSDLFDSSVVETEYITTPIEEIQRQLEIYLVEDIEAERLAISRDLNDVRIRFSSDDFYRSGSAVLQPQARDLLDRVLAAIQENKYDDYKIDVEGHTDDAPISSSTYPSNWELSTARASNVVKYFIDNGINKNRLKASGYADSKPRMILNEDGEEVIAPRDMNRRVVLRLYYSLEDREKRKEEQEEAIAEAADEATATDKPSDADPTDNSKVEPDEDELNDPVTANQPDAVPSPPPAEEKKESTVAQKPEKEAAPAPSTKEVEALSKFDFGPQANCIFSVQVGGFRNLSDSFEVADDVERRTGFEFSVDYTENEYVVRTPLNSSFAKTLSDYSSIATAMPALNAGMVHRCGSGVSSPQTTAILQYMIQFGAFNNEQNALNYSFDLFDEFGIQTYMNRTSDKYLVVAGPYDERNIALDSLQQLSNRGFDKNAIIKPNIEDRKTYTYRYRIQINAFENRDEAVIAALNAERSLSINTHLIEFEQGLYYVLVTDPFNSWSETTRQFRRISRSNVSDNPVIHIIEKE